MIIPRAPLTNPRPIQTTFLENVISPGKRNAEDRLIFIWTCTGFSHISVGNRAAPPPPTQPPPAAREETAIKKKEEEEEDDEETSSSSEETESETEEESETDAHPSGTTTSTTPSTTAQDRQRSESAMARTDIGPLLARSAEARRGSKEDSPTTRQVYFLPTILIRGFLVSINK